MHAESIRGFSPAQVKISFRIDELLPRIKHCVRTQIAFAMSRRCRIGGINPLQQPHIVSLVKDQLHDWEWEKAPIRPT